MEKKILIAAATLLVVIICVFCYMYGRKEAFAVQQQMNEQNRIGNGE